MLNIIAENSLLRIAVLFGLFALVAAVAYIIANAFAAKQATRRRLVDTGSAAAAETMAGGSLRSDRVEGAWLKLVNAIENSGLSLVDTKDKALRQKLIAAGFTAPHAPRVYTLVRLVLVVALP